MSARSARRGILCMVAGVLACAAVATHAHAQRPLRTTRVLVIYAPVAEATPVPMFIERLRTTVRNALPPPVEFYEEFLDVDRFPDPSRRPELARYFRDKYRDFPVDVVVTIGSVALHFATRELRDVFPATPVVFGMTFAHRVVLSSLPTYVTGRLITIPLGSTMELARALQPDATQALVVAGASAADSVALASALLDLGPARDGPRLVVRRGLPMDALLGELRRLPRSAIVFVANFRMDGRAQSFVPREAIEQMARESRAPVYSYLDNLVGSGIVGGGVLRYEHEAARTGELVARVLTRRAGQPLPPVERADTRFIVDWRQLRRWGLDEDRLPPTSEVRLRMPSLWERYHTVVAAGLAIVAAQSVLIGALLVERRRRRRAQRSLAEQAAYERTMAQLTTDAVRHGTDDAPRALEDALARVATYAGAHEAVLSQDGDPHAGAPPPLVWREGPSSDGSGSRVELPLVVGGRRVGALALRRRREGGKWPLTLVARLGSAAQVLADAVERSRATQAAEESRRQVAHLGRVALVGELAAAISHELRQPLTAIRANAELGRYLLAESRPSVDEARQLFDDIVADDQRASEVIDHIRLLLRKQETGVDRIDLCDVARHAVALLMPDARRRAVKLVLLPLPDRLPVVANVVELRQVALNLVLNALEATAGTDGARRVVVGAHGEGDDVELFVRDSGPGLSPEVQARLFDSFFTTKQHGLGLGLVIVRSIVQRHGGRVTAENAAAGGAEFRVVLPVASGAPLLELPPVASRARQIM